MTSQEQQIEMLTAKLSELENESRRILNALQWATKVRMILFSGLLLFALISAFLFIRLYNDIKTRRVAEVQRLINEDPAKFSEPLTRQLVSLAEEQGPYVIEVFRDQAQQDSNLYMAAFDVEREKMIANLQRSVEDKLARSYVAVLDEQEKLLKREFPVLEDPVKMEVVRGNMEKIYQKIGNRYYVNFLKEELDELAEKMDTFPVTDPRQDNVPIAEQIATEFLELVRLMLIHSENYQIPQETNVSVEVPPASKRLPDADVDSVKEPKTGGEDKSPETTKEPAGTENDSEKSEDKDNN